MIERTVDAAGVTLRWEEEGDGDAVVFIHGIPTGPALWRHVVPHLAGMRCMAWEMVGYGRSIEQGEGRDISVGRQADYLIGWMDAIGLDTAVLVGHDLGGGVAQIAAVRHPERVRGLVLANSIGYDSWPIPSVKFLRAIAPLLAKGPDLLVCIILMVLFLRAHDNYERMRESLDVHWKPYSDVNATRALARQVNALDVRDTLDVADRLSTIKIPAAVVWGAADQFQKLRYGERLAHDLGAPIDRIEGGKHYVPEDHPDRVASAVEDVVGRAKMGA